MKAPSNNNRQLNGFALVATILLMVLLAIITIGTLSLSAVSLRSGSHDQALLEARANARLGLMLAIGQLQTELGPDQRINAPADLANQTLSGGRQKWVGTWESWPATATKRPAPQFRRWLVSGAPQELGRASFPSQASNLVTLMRGKGSDLMAAPKVALPNGGFAYAVADENSKARLGPSLPYAGLEDLADHLTNYQSPPVGHELLPGLKAVTRDEARLDSLISVKTADLLPGSQTASENDTTSFTVWSEGLLTDVRNGGFRKDLSLYFQDPNSGSMTNALYKNGASNGINFQELRNFHEVSSRLTYNASSFTHPDGGKLNPDVPCLVGQSSQAGVINDPFFSYLRPMMIRVGWNFSAYSILDPPTGRYRICIVVDPLVWLWNPFDVNLVVNPGGHFGIRCWGVPYSFTIKVGSAAPVTKSFKQMDPALGGTFVGLNVGSTVPLAMRPGEVLIYGRGRVDTNPTQYSANTNVRLHTEAKLGWSNKGGYWIDTTLRANPSDQVSISMAPNTEGQSSGGKNMMVFGLTVGKLPSSGGSPYTYGGLSMGTPDGLLNSTKFPPAMFKSVPAKTFNASNLTTQQPLGIFSYFARTENESTLKSRYLARLNPAAMSYGHQAADNNTLQSLPFEPFMQPISGGLDVGIESDNGKGFFGASYKALSGQSYLVTHSVPREPPISLGGFQHALANGLGLSVVAGKIVVTAPLQPSITHAIGNSFAPPCIAPDQTTGTFNNNTPVVDHSWLANDALWDQWFVSSLATRNAPYLSAAQTGTARSQFEKFAGTNGQPVPLRNRHYLYAGNNPASDVTDLFSSATPKSDAYLKVASLMRVQGAFNINSTDSAAWLAMFHSTSGLKVAVEPSDGTARQWQTASNPIADLLIPKGSAVDSNQLTDPSNENQWIGYRDPTNDELKELADAMVGEVRKRGPFLSLADFVNRRLDSDPGLASRGALQAALDASLNKKLESGARSSSGGASGVAFAKADAGSQMTHVPGHVKQGDILTTLGTKFTPRSDTFTIRAYGESRSANGTLLAKARCEAVVQRSADYVDPADQRQTLPASLTSEANKQFGRKFTIVSFRWLSELES